MTEKHRNGWIVIIGVPVLLMLLAWAGARYDASKLDTSRFVADSIRREYDRDILSRVDRRVEAMYCADKPPGCQR